MMAFYFTFALNTNLANSYVVLYAKDYLTARTMMFNKYGEGWAFQYDAVQFEESIGIYNLKEVEFGTACIKLLA